MGTGLYEGTVFALQNAPLISTLPRAALAGGLVYCSTDRAITLTDDGIEQPSVFKVGKLPKGAIVLYSVIYPIALVTFDAIDGLTGATTGVLGISTDTDLFGDVGALDGATPTPQIIIPKPDGSVYANRLSPLVAKVDVIFTSATAHHTTEEGFVVQIFYTVAGQV